LPSQSHIAIAVLIDRLFRVIDCLYKLFENDTRRLRAWMSPQILDASSAADWRFSPTKGMKPTVFERKSSSSRDREIAVMIGAPERVREQEGVVGVKTEQDGEIEAPAGPAVV
jgi:hypothetical protein